MAKLSLVKGTTSYRAYVFIQDSNVTTGAGLTGLVFNSPNLVASYVRPGAARVAITLGTQTVTGAYSSGGFVEVDSTNMPGLYRLDIPDAALATGVNAVVVMLKGATNMVPCVLEVELTATDNQAATTGGITNLDATISSRSTYAGGAVASVTGAVGSVTAAVTVGTNNDKTGYALSSAGNNSTADALLDRANAVEAGATPRQSLRLILAALAGKLSGAATSTVIIRNAVADSKDRIVATVDADGNRSSVVVDVS
jgi:hypothetical protein